MTISLALSIVPEGIDNVALFVVLGSLSAMLLGVAKAGFGGGIGILSGPIMIYACASRTELALGIMLPLLIACDAVAVISWWGRWDTKPIKSLIPGLLVGIVLGALAIWGFQRLGQTGQKQTTDALLKLGIGLIALGFVVLQSLRALRKRKRTFHPVFWQSSCVGAAAGFTSTLAHAAGPIIAMYLLPQGMPKGRFVATTVLYYWFGNLAKLLPYFLLGLIDTQSLTGSVLLLPSVIVGALLGVFLHHRVGQKSFTGIVYVLLALAGVHLCIKAISSL